MWVFQTDSFRRRTLVHFRPICRRFPCEDTEELTTLRLCARIPPLKYSPVPVRSPSKKEVLRNLVVEESSMATTTPIPAPEAPVTISPFGRVIGVFFSPGKTFEDIVRKPSWMLPLLLTTILSIGVSF